MLGKCLAYALQELGWSDQKFTAVDLFDNFTLLHFERCGGSKLG